MEEKLKQVRINGKTTLADKTQRQGNRSYEKKEKACVEEVSNLHYKIGKLHPGLKTDVTFLKCDYGEDYLMLPRAKIAHINNT